MLLYNQRKEFIGIDEDDLTALDFQNINELQNESQDFADLFVKKPGYIHNFKNFSWIDFILHSEADEAKAIIHAKGKNYSCILHITPFHFTADESGFAVIIKNLKVLKGAEDAQTRKDIENSGKGVQPTPTPVKAPVTPTTSAVSSTPSPELDISLDDIKLNAPEKVPEFNEPEPELPSFESSPQHELNEPEPLDVPEVTEVDLDLSTPPVDDYLSIENEFDTPTENEFGAPSNIDFDAPLDIGEDLMQDDVTEEVEEPASEEPVSQEQEAPMLGDYVSEGASEHLSELVSSGTYQYDPSVAAGELGLPVDLIEEFIGDFIDQAYEFKDDLFASVNASDFDNVQVLSHKLKGVAANLRVEDAFDVLSVVNTSKEPEEIMPNLTQFYKIIAKLEGKEIAEEVPQQSSSAPIQTPEEASTTEIEEDNYDIGIKQPDEGPILIDEEVHTHENDDLYADMLPPVEQVEESVNLSETLPEDNDDLYDDLLAEPSFTDPMNNESENIASTQEAEETFSAQSLQEDSADIYDDLLAEPSFEEPLVQVPEPEEALDTSDVYDDLLDTPANEDAIDAPENGLEVSPINFDPQSSANQLGIPVEIVKEFVEDFKGQVSAHQIDFTHALDNNDIKEINATATLLKGMSDNLRLNEISEVLQILQSETNINNTADNIAKVQAYADQL